MWSDSISLNKAGIIERCLRRMREEYSADPELGNYTHLDALVLNIEREAVVSNRLSVVGK